MLSSLRKVNRYKNKYVRFANKIKYQVVFIKKRFCIRSGKKPFQKSIIGIFSPLCLLDPELNLRSNVDIYCKYSKTKLLDYLDNKTLK